ncbi:uncharacterized protein LOC135370772 isoform X2 [Ornithodoros turicata]
MLGFSAKCSRLKPGSVPTVFLKDCTDQHRSTLSPNREVEEESITASSAAPEGYPCTAYAGSIHDMCYEEVVDSADVHDEASELTEVVDMQSCQSGAALTSSHIDLLSKIEESDVVTDYEMFFGKVVTLSLPFRMSLGIDAAVQTEQFTATAATSTSGVSAASMQTDISFPVTSSPISSDCESELEPS